MPQTVWERHRPADALVSEALAASEQRVFWLDDLGTGPGHPRLSGRVDADLVVVGGGYTGLWTALLAVLREPGRAVVVLEASTLGWAASGRNGGFCEASLTHGDDNGEARWPAEMDLLRRLGRDNLDGIQADVAALGLDAEFERTGSLAVAVEEYQAAQLRDEGGPEYRDAAAARALIDSPRFLAGSFDADGTALVHPAKLVAELARVAVEHGVRIFEHAPATDLDTGGEGVVVRTAAGAVHARQAALATNVFPPLLARYRLHTVPVYDYVLMTEPLSDARLASIGWAGRSGLSDLANQFHYARLTRDNRILWGGYDAVYHYGRKVRSAYEDRPASYATLASHFLTVFPQLEGIRFTHRWAGAIDTSTRFCAFHGLARGGRVAYAAGFTGLGVAATRFAAEVMLDRLAGAETERTELEMVRTQPLPFPPEPLAAVGINATRWSLDRADHREGRRNALLRTLDALGLGFDS
jgi:glycine/D-amino acid oxidase-like deaminating enzyme